MTTLSVPAVVPDDGSDYEQVTFEFDEDSSRDARYVKIERTLYYDGMTVNQETSVKLDAILEFVAERVRADVLAAVTSAPWWEMLKS